MTDAVSVKVDDTCNKSETLIGKFDFDSVLRDEVGQFGRFQVWNIILALIAIVFLAWNNKAYVFTTGRIPTRCYIPQCDTEEPEFTPDWLLNAVPGTLSSFDNCQRYANASIALGEGVCPSAWFNRNQLQVCERWLYQNTDTIVYDFQLACDEWRRTLIGSMRSAATLIGHTITGFISDRWGRRTSLVFNVFNAAWIGVLSSFSNSYILFAFLECLQSLFGSGTLLAANVLLMELVRPESRVLAGTFLYTSISIGFVLLGVIAWAVPNWRELMRALFIPQLLTIVYIWMMSESVRWYISKGRYEESKKALKTIARVNKKHLSDRTLNLLKKHVEEKVNPEKPSQNVQTQVKPLLMKLLFQYKTILLRCLVTPFMWISFTIIYHGLAINAVDISGNKYVNFTVVAVAQIPGYWISYLLLDRIGRKPVLATSYFVCAVCLIGFTFIPKNHYVLSLSVYMVGSTCSGTILSALYIYTAELYPTQYRHRLFAFSSAVGRLGSIIAPLTPVLGTLVWEQLPFALFAGCACVAGALVLLMPETRGARLPDTMQEAADLGKSSR